MAQFDYVLRNSKGTPLLRQFVNILGGYRYHWHNCLEVQLIIAGECEICVEGSVYYLVPDDIILINTGQGHASLRHRGNCLSIVTHVYPEYLCQLGVDPNTVKLSCNSAAEKTRETRLFQSLRFELCSCLLAMQSGTLRGFLAARGHLSLFLAKIIEHSPPKSTDMLQNKRSISQQKRIASILRFISRNYRKKLSLNEVAKYAGYNKSYFSTLFKTTMGIGFHEFITRCRLQSATAELGSDKPISEIALDNGFSDEKAFNWAFRRNFNKTPSEYRRNLTPSDLTSLRRQLAEENNPIVLDYLRRYSNDNKDTKKVDDVPFCEIPLTLRADASTIDIIKQLSSKEFTIYLNNKKK